MDRQSYLERLTRAAELPGESLPGLPIIEIAGDRRVLIERHKGVLEYDCNQIRIRVSYGSVCVCGCQLEISQITKAQLVVTGKIQSVTVQRG